MPQPDAAALSSTPDPAAPTRPDDAVARPPATDESAGSEPGPAAPASPDDGLSTRDRLLRDLLGHRRMQLGTLASDRFWGVFGALLITALAALVRFYELARPGKLVFDETYYVKEGYSLMRLGWEAAWPENPNPAFESGNVDSYLDHPEYVVHPPVGKWMIALGMRVLGGASDPMAWRFASAVVGVVAVLLIIRIARRLFASTAMGLVAGLLLAVDGGAIVHSRTGLLDQFLMFWVLVAFGCLVMDREWARRRLADRVASVIDSGGIVGLYGPPLGFRWWRLAAAVSLGLACGVKWSGLYFVAAFCLLTVAWDLAARRAAGVRRWFEDGLLADALPAALVMLPTVALTYVATWSAWFASEKSYMRATDTGLTPPSWMPSWAHGAWDGGRSLWEYHTTMWGFHTTLEAEHSYAAHPAGWIVQWRPTSFFWERPEPGQGGCPADAVEACAAAVTSLGNPLLWWLAALAIPAAVGLIVQFSDWRGLAILTGTAAGWLPWFAYSAPFADRTIFTFYSIVFTPFVVLTLTYVFTVWLEATEGRRRARRAAVATIVTMVVLIVAVSALFYPLWTAQPVSYDYWHRLMWLPQWI
ncbi:dolichyl-phosphate-mannose--protein mannosyltransferase [Antribacter gilvus]|uniref:dolichyl-phosphate-mannose--protein mannosyltransferase n=1 Tax=Antribacter gilvus TaxID=2304675 RepID=UPI001F0B85DD|nr:phospholipid carrier-dependent glycosyltransferase [Antribacter gilvus]